MTEGQNRMTLKQELRQELRRYRRHLCEFFGSDRYSRPALNDIDRKLQKHLPHRDGVFIEVGANDGFAQSNTYYFERMQGWTGVLIEPMPDLYEKCVKERPNSIVFNCALVSNDDDGQTVTMLYSNLMSLVRGAQKSESMDSEHVRRGAAIQRSVEDVYEITVPARTLTSILDELVVKRIDLFSLDTEGYELEVLRGLHLTRYRPKFILVEAWFRDEIETHLSNYDYQAIDSFSE